jgi:hypothetical protein
MATELISLAADKSGDPRFAVCYARGSSFKQEGKFHRVEKGKRALVSRALCVVETYGSRCRQCPNHSVTLVFKAHGASDGPR